MGCRRIDAERAMEQIYRAAIEQSQEPKSEAAIDLRFQQANRAADLLIELYKEDALNVALRIEENSDQPAFPELVRKAVAFRMGRG